MRYAHIQIPLDAEKERANLTSRQFETLKGMARSAGMAVRTFIVQMIRAKLKEKVR